MKTALVLAMTIFSFGASAAYDHAAPAWARLLAANVIPRGSASTVDYAAIKAKPDELSAYIKSVEDVARSEFDGFTLGERQAFLVNTYNAYTVKLAVDNFPLKAFKDIGGLFANPWKKRDVFKLFRQSTSLDMIEAELRKAGFDPRLNFALSNASKSGPRLATKPYLASDLEKQLSDATNLFVADRTRNGYDPRTNTFEVSPLFKWHRDDFKLTYQSVPAFLARFMKLDPPLTEAAIGKAEVKYLDYDWSLNGKKP